MREINTVIGEIIVKGDTQTFGSGFTKREFVVKTNDPKYPQHLKFELMKDNCALLDSFEIGDNVEVSYNLRGNEYSGSYYVNLICWKLKADSAMQPHPPQAQQQRPGTMQQAVDDDDSIPF